MKPQASSHYCCYINMFRNEEYNTRLYFRGQRPEATLLLFGVRSLGRGLEWVLGTGVGYLPWVAGLARECLAAVYPQSDDHRATTSVLHRALFGGI